MQIEANSTEITTLKIELEKEKENLNRLINRFSRQRRNLREAQTEQWNTIVIIL